MAKFDGKFIVMQSTGAQLVLIELIWKIRKKKADKKIIIDDVHCRM